MHTLPLARPPRDTREIELGAEPTDNDERARIAPRLDLALVRESRSGLEISVLDTFAFRAGDAGIALPGTSRKLLALLALREQPMTRLLIAGTLWPEVAERDASCSLRSALWRLKAAAGETLDVAHVDLGLRDDVAVDLRHARALARRLITDSGGSRRDDTSPQAVRLLSGDLLPGWYDDWVLVEAAEWHQLRLHALEALSARLVAEGRCADAIQAALATVRAEPLRESAHGALIKSFIAEGNQNEALKDYYEFRDLLRQELGIDPSPHLTNLVDTLHRRRADD